MGKEARAAARFGEEAGMVTALLEGDTLVLRGEIRASLQRNTIRGVKVEHGELLFTAGDVPVVLTLGTTAANRWATALIAGPPTLETKLGILETSRVRVFGKIDDEALELALAHAAVRLRGEERTTDPATLVFVRADGARELEAALTKQLKSVEADVPIWVVYRKGKDMPLNEAGVRAAVRARGLVDTKVAGVSATLSAQRFNKRVAEEPTTVVLPARPIRRAPSSAPRKKSSGPAPARKKR